MPVSAADIMAYQAPAARQLVSKRDAILYALSVGYGAEPDNLAALYERDLVPVPTLANIVAHPGPWMKATGVDWTRVVHAEQRLTLHRPLPLEVELASRSRMLSVVDRGEGKGMFAYFERVIFDPATETPIATIIQSNGCRGDGGCGSAGEPLAPLPRVPERAPDAELDLEIPVSAALLYRLNGDLNPLHVDPAVAAAAGFPKPILHGLCTFGYAGYAIGRLTGTTDLAQIAARFTAPTFPGEVLKTRIWRDGSELRFQCRVEARNAIVLDSGLAVTR